MTPEQEKNAKEFFAMLAKYGVTETICLKPAPGGSAKATIEKDGELSAIDQRDGKRKKIKIQ